jgi:hypothetical protein
MNRQVGPSIVLSVLIVCFFAVALYQRDPPRPSHGRARSGPADAIAWSGSTPPPGPMRASSGQSESAEPPQPVPARREVPARSIALAPDSSTTAFERAPAHSSRPRGVNSVGSEGSKSGERIETARQPGAAFTVVLANETLQDVACRVYGSGALADSLWRSNRDALSRRESPLSEGMVLRTPVVR